MANYRTTGQVNYNGKLIEAGKPITFKAGDEDVIDELLEAGAIEIGKAEQADVEQDDDEEISLEELAAEMLKKMTVKQLTALAVNADIELPGNATKAQIIEKLEAHQAEAAKAAADASQAQE